MWMTYMKFIYIWYVWTTHMKCMYTCMCEWHAWNVCIHMSYVYVYYLCDKVFMECDAEPPQNVQFVYLCPIPRRAPTSIYGMGPKHVYWKWHSEWHYGVIWHNVLTLRMTYGILWHNDIDDMWRCERRVCLNMTQWHLWTAA